MGCGWIVDLWVKLSDINSYILRDPIFLTLNSKIKKAFILFSVKLISVDTFNKRAAYGCSSAKIFSLYNLVLSFTTF